MLIIYMRAYVYGRARLCMCSLCAFMNVLLIKTSMRAYMYVHMYIQCMYAFVFVLLRCTIPKKYRRKMCSKNPVPHPVNGWIKM